MTSVTITFESAIAIVIYQLCESNSILNGSQFSFSQKLSREPALNTMVDDSKTSNINTF